MLKAVGFRGSSSVSKGTAGSPGKEAATEHSPAANQSSGSGEEQVGLKLFQNPPATATAPASTRPVAIHKAALSTTSLAVTLLNRYSETQGGGIRHEEITAAGEPLAATALAKALPRRQTSCQIDFDLINLFRGQPAAAAGEAACDACLRPLSKGEAF